MKLKLKEFQVTIDIYSQNITVLARKPSEAVNKAVKKMLKEGIDLNGQWNVPFVEDTEDGLEYWDVKDYKETLDGERFRVTLSATKSGADEDSKSETG